MKKNIILTLPLIAVCIMAYAQSPQPNMNIILANNARMLEEDSKKPVIWDKNELKDISSSEFIYYYAAYDPDYDLMLDSEHILQVGPTVSLFSQYGSYRIDSLNYVNDVADTKMTRGEYDRIRGDIDGRFSGVLRNHINNDELTVYDRIFINSFWYKEPQPDFEWTIGNDVKDIGGYNCRIATTRFRGRDWTAWFTEDIPIPEGPWKFAGLPGLIVMVQDSDREHTYKLLRTRNKPSAILIPDNLWSRTDRKTFNKRKRDYEADPLKAIEGSEMVPTNPDGTPMKPDQNVKRFVNFIEKE